MFEIKGPLGVPCAIMGPVKIQFQNLTGGYVAFPANPISEREFYRPLTAAPHAVVTVTDEYLAKLGEKPRAKLQDFLNPDRPNGAVFKVVPAAPAEVAPAEIVPAEIVPAEIVPAEFVPAEVAPRRRGRPRGS